MVIFKSYVTNYHRVDHIGSSDPQMCFKVFCSTASSMPDNQPPGIRTPEVEAEDPRLRGVGVALDFHILRTYELISGWWF